MAKLESAYSFMLKYSKITVCAALAKWKFYPLQVWYVMIHVIKHDIDPNSNINYCIKIPKVSNSVLSFTSLVCYYSCNQTWHRS